MASDVQQTALAALAAGLSTVPIRPGGKVPACSWEPYQRHAMQPADVDRMFRNGCGIGLVCGTVSGNLELLDFDDPELFPLRRVLQQKPVPLPEFEAAQQSRETTQPSHETNQD